MKLRISKGKPRRQIDREALIDAALQLGLREGWKAVTIRSIATHVGYTSPVLYEYFQNKDEVLLEIARRGFKQVETSLRDTSGTPDQRVTHMVNHFWSFVVENKQLYKLMHNMEGVLIDSSQLLHEAQITCAIIVEIITAWAQAHKKPRINAERVTDDLWALLHGMAALSIDREVPFDALRARTAVSTYLKGLLAPQ